MSYVATGFSVISNSTAPFTRPRLRFTVAQYKNATDTIATIVADGYFDEVLYGTNGLAGKENGVLNTGDLIVIEAPDSTAVKTVILYDDAGTAKVRESAAYGVTEVVTGASAQTTFVVAIPGLAIGTPVTASIATSSVTPTPIIGVDNTVVDQVTITIEAAYTGDITFSLVVGA
ncbi:MAG: hypothetical protein KAI17_03250 [Thiotrichaceae bacterium]|nr:hypothetical protein [Thiotrichaceae bacterium]